MKKYIQKNKDSVLANLANKKPRNADEVELKYDRNTFGHLVRYQMLVKDNMRDAQSV